MFSRTTPVIRNIITINAIVFVAQLLMPILTNYLGLWGVQTPNFRPYQLFTYMFAHGSFFHILFNMLLLNVFGSTLEEYWGQKKFLLFYMIAGIGAGGFNFLMDLFFGIGSFSLMIGASGAVYAVMTAFGIIFPNMEMRFFLLPISIRAKYLVMILGSLAIYSGFNSDPRDNTAHFAHLGGIVIALILIQFWKSPGRDRW
jgi:membrane associated rhomboid family serine protease